MQQIHNHGSTTTGTSTSVNSSTTSISTSSSQLSIEFPDHHQTNQISTSQTNVSTDMLLAPFLISSTSLIPLSHFSPRRYLASWLHVLVMVRMFANDTTTLNTAIYMSRLRHPNLELLLGASLPSCESKSHCGLLVTEYINGPPLETLLTLSAPTLSLCKAFSVAVDICRALVYLHATVHAPHGAVSSNTVLVDSNRGRAVLLLATEKECDCIQTDDIQMDVYCMAQLIVKLFCKTQNVDIDNNKMIIEYVKYVPEQLQLIIWDTLQKGEHDDDKSNMDGYVSMEQLCKNVIYAAEKI